MGQRGLMRFVSGVPICACMKNEFFTEKEMGKNIFSGLDCYDTPSGVKRSWVYNLMFRSRWYFYFHNFGIFIRSGLLGKRGKLDQDAQIRLSTENVQLIERMGGSVHVRGLEHLRACNGKPAVIVGNHMSLLETGLLHALVREHMDISFVVKASLLDVPIFRHILKSMNAIPVSRTNPREDLKTVLCEGKKKLESGCSMIVFPQSTRSSSFDPEQFNSIGIKLAKSAGVPVIPLALRTDFLSLGKVCRDLGPVHPERPVRFEFGAPIVIEGNGQAQQQQVVDFISGCFERWKAEDAGK